MIQYRRQLPELMKRLGLPMIAVEVGVAEFNFSEDLLNNGIEKLYSIDAWQTLNQTGDGGFEQEWHDKNYDTANLKSAKFGDKSIIIRGLSYRAAFQIPDNSVSLVYLDGDHSLSGVSKDLEAFYPKLISGGILAGHDFLSPAYGVKQAVTEFCDKHRYNWTLIPEDKDEDSGFYFIKR